jgi:hypothetical protein
LTLLALLSLALGLTLLTLVRLALLRLARRLLALASLRRLTLLALLLRAALLLSSTLRLTGAPLLLTRSRRATIHLRAALGRSAGLAAGSAAHVLGRRHGKSCQ